MREYQTRGSEHRTTRERPRSDKRTRIPAVLVLLLVVCSFVLVAAVTGSSAEGDKQPGSVPFKILPLSPENLGSSGQSGGDTSTTQASGSTTTTTTATEDTISEGEGGDAGTAESVEYLVATEAASTAKVEAVSAAAKKSAADVPILMYHYVDDVPPPAGLYASALTVRADAFEAQMKYLAENGYTAVSMRDLYLAKRGGKVLPAKSVLITFDDGGLDNYSVAFPILLKYRLKATFYVVTGSVGASGRMDWDDLREMMSRGMSVESHTVSHPLDLRAVDDARLVHELTESRLAIGRNLGLAPATLSYPAGRYDDRVIEAARSAGYLLAVSTYAGTDEGATADYQMRRTRVAPSDSLEDFAAALR